MQIYKRALGIFIGGACLAALATADATQDFKSYYMAKVVPAMKKAMAKGDVAFFDKSSTSTFTSTDYGKKAVDKATALSMMKQTFAAVSNLQAKMGAATFKADSKQGVVIATWTYTGKTMADAQGKKHSIVIVNKSKETWVKKGNGWLIQSMADVSPSKISMDGHPVQVPAG